MGIPVIDCDMHVRLCCAKQVRPCLYKNICKADLLLVTNVCNTAKHVDAANILLSTEHSFSAVAEYIGKHYYLKRCQQLVLE